MKKKNLTKDKLFGLLAAPIFNNNHKVGISYVTFLTGGWFIISSVNFGIFSIMSILIKLIKNK